MTTRWQYTKQTPIVNSPTFNDCNVLKRPSVKSFFKICCCCWCSSHNKRFKYTFVHSPRDVDTIVVPLQNHKVDIIPILILEHRTLFAHISQTSFCCFRDHLFFVHSTNDNFPTKAVSFRNNGNDNDWSGERKIVFSRKRTVSNSLHLQSWEIHVVTFDYHYVNDISADFMLVTSSMQSSGTRLSLCNFIFKSPHQRCFFDNCWWKPCMTSTKHEPWGPNTNQKVLLLQRVDHFQMNAWVRIVRTIS